MIEKEKTQVKMNMNVFFSFYKRTKKKEKKWILFDEIVEKKTK